ncbi:hypothetical protein ACF1AE_03340 [Streptomyces sp. NPDC014986]|uniref:hypothetical protein n=1 Tax=Streptomyces sp. NPDC014986 TaxID=3364934 RepID=UPI0037021FF2
MGELIVRIIGIVAVLVLVLTAFGGLVGEVEPAVLTVLLVAALTYVVVDHRRSPQDG